MSDPAKIEYHSRRAMRELDAGLTASSIAAARAHLQLSNLHMQRMRELAGDAAAGIKPPLTL
jgi:succinate dehydrogenase flavin-adding protein (antitoxin of CptAB toxin-antitoxin module)